MIKADPYNWPYDGVMSPADTALIIIDMQTDFCGEGGYVDTMGYDIGLTPRAHRAHRGRARGHARGRLPHLPYAGGPSAGPRRSAGQQALAVPPRLVPGSAILAPAACILIRGEPGWEIIPELAPQPNEPVIDKPGKGSFYATDLELLMRVRGVRNLILTGITTDVCVHTTMRDANDRGFECLLLEDCCAATDRANHEHAVKMIKMQGGVFGSVSNSTAFLAGLA